MTLAGSRALSPNMFGREAQLNALLHQKKLAEGNNGRIVFVSGDAGIGKTRLTSEFLRQISAEDEILSLQGHCFDAEPAPPYGPVLDTLLQLIRIEGAERVAQSAGHLGRDLLPILPEISPYLDDQLSELDPRVQKQRLFDALFQVLSTDPKGRIRIILLEDLQWSDASTRELLPFIAQRIDKRPVLILGTYRSDELHRRHPFNSTLATLTRMPAFHEIKLNPLTPMAVAEMLEAILERPLPDGFVDAFHTRTGGNPFFIEELLKSILEEGRIGEVIEEANKGHGISVVDIPTTVAASVLIRMDSLTEDDQRILDHAAVIGRRFGFDMLRQLTGSTEQALSDSLQRLIRERLVDEVGGERDFYQFRHALTREAIYEAMVQRQRRMIHQRVLDFLERFHGEKLEAIADQLAYHSQMAKDLASSRRYSRMAGGEAIRKLAHREAIAHLETALELMDEAETKARADLLFELGLAAYPTGDTRLYSRYWTRAQKLYRDLGEDRTAAQISLRLSRLAWERGDAPEAFSHARQALEAYGEDDQGEEAALVYSVLSQLHMLSSQFDETVRWGEKALKIARKVESPFVQVHALNNLGTSYHEHGRVEEGLSLLEESIQRTGGLSANFETLRVYGNYGECLFKSGRLAQAREVLEKGMIVATEAGLQLHRGFLLGNLGSIALEEGRWQEAEDYLHQALRAADLGLPIAGLFAAPWMAELHRRRGHLTAALEIIEKNLAVAESHGEYQILRTYLPVLLQVQFELGNIVELDESIDRAYNLVKSRTALVGSEWLLVMTAKMLAHRDRMQEAESVREALEDLLDRTGLWIVEAHFCHLVGHLSAARSSWDQAASAWRKSIQLWRENGYPYQEAVDRKALAMVLTEMEQLEDAQDQAIQGAAIFRRLGATDEISKSEEINLGIDLEDTAVSGKVEALTPREEEVLRHLSLGKSNRDIAEDLFISVKTVEVHVSNILGKLGVSSRTEAVAYAARRGWIEMEADQKDTDNP